MKADFGWDFLGDISFTADGDIRVVEGPQLVAQDVRGSALASRGSLFYAPDFGGGLVDLLRSPGSSNAAVVQKLRAAALDDERIDWATVESGQFADGKYYLKFSVLGELQESVLLFDIADILAEVLGD
ncbi:MAG: hypothetical protein AAF975_00125 [Spirochaetota bacterium]